MKFVNLTPHAINIVREDDEELIATIPPSGTIARVNMTRKQIGEVCGIPTFVTQYGEPTGIPEPSEDTIYIVSSLVVQALPDRPDVWAPGDLVRDGEGRVIGCVGLSRPVA